MIIRVKMASAFLVVAAALPAVAAPIVSIGNYSVAAGQTATVLVSVSDTGPASAEDIEGMTFTLQIAAGTGTTPSISSIDLITGTVWAPVANSSDVFPAAGEEPQYDSLDIINNAAGEYINANGLLATVTINTANAPANVYSLQLTNTMTAGADSAFLNVSGSTVPATFTPGTLTIVVPEPSLISAMSVALISLTRRRR